MTEALADRELDAWIAEHVMGVSALRMRYDGYRKYSSCLNACAQAEAKIVEMGLHGAYQAALQNTHYNSEHGDTCQHFMAQARQRSEAMYVIRERIKEEHR